MKLPPLNKLCETIKPLSVVHLDYLTLAVGPEHHDLQLYSTNGNKEGRLIFDSTVEHLSQIKIEITNMKCIVNTLAKKDITLQLKLKADNQIFESDFIKPIDASTVNVNEKQIVYSWINSDKDKLILVLPNFCLSNLADCSLTLNVYDTNLIKKEAINTKDSLSKITKEVNEETFCYKLGNRLGLTTYNISKLIHDNSSTMTKQSSIIFKQASAFHKSPYPNSTPVNKAIEDGQKPEENEENFEIKFQVFENVDTAFCEELFSVGKSIGTVEGRIIVSKIPLIKQIVCGVHTERGLDISSHYLAFNQNSNNSTNETTKEVKMLENETKNLLMKLAETTALTTIGQKGKETNKEILDHLKEINRILLLSTKDKSLFYNYSNQNEILHAQEIMLQLGNALISMIDNIKLDHGKQAYKIISAILNRAEFDLGTMAYNIEVDDEETLSQRIYLCQEFINFLNSIISYVLDKFARKINDKDVQAFVEHVLSVCYFRSPKFRDAFLEAISLNCDYYLGEEVNRKNSGFNYEYMKKFGQGDHKNIDYLSGLKGNKDEMYINPIVSSIDWADLFYGKLDNLLLALKNSPKQLEILKKNANYQINKSFKEIVDKLNTSLGNSDWKDRLSKRNLGFFTIVKKLEDYIRIKIIVNREIEWEDVPGFDYIIMSLIHELKTRDVAKYPKLLIDVLVSFVNNCTLMNIFFSTAARRTNIHDTNAVFNFICLIDTFIKTADNKISNLKTYFDYNLLKQCIDVILENDHSLCVSKLLWFLYEDTHLLNDEQIHDAVVELITNSFYRYFFHWSWQVRHVFYHFILYTVQHRLIKQAAKNSRRQPQQNGSSTNLTEVFTKSIYGEVIARRLNEIDLLSQQIIGKEMDMSFKNQFQIDEIKEIVKVKVPANCYDFIVASIIHFKPVLKEYEQWIEHNKKQKSSILNYPEVTLSQLKDDIIDYTESWS